MQENSDLRKRKEEILRHIRDERWKEAFELLVETFQNDIYRYCFRRVGGEYGEDVAQEVFLAAWKALPRIRLEHQENSIAPWLYGIAKNELLDAIVKLRHRKEGSFNREGEETAAPATADVDTIPNILDLQRSMIQLPEKDRRILMYYLQGFTGKEIAGFLGGRATPGSVRIQIYRLIKKLKTASHDD